MAMINLAWCNFLFSFAYMYRERHAVVINNPVSRGESQQFTRRTFPYMDDEVVLPLSIHKALGSSLGPETCQVIQFICEITVFVL
jgi:hypothetical protein